MSWPQIPELDVETGLSRVAGHEGLYRSLLLRFPTRQSQVVHQINQAVQAGQSEEAVRLAHTLKGLAALMGAGPLSRSAAALEAALRADQPCEGALAATEHDLKYLIAALEKWSPAPPPTSGVELDLDQYEMLLSDLKWLLLRDDARARDCAASLALVGGPQAEGAHRLARQLNQYQFEEALVSVGQLAQSLGLKIEEDAL